MVERFEGLDWIRYGSSKESWLRDDYRTFEGVRWRHVDQREE